MVCPKCECYYEYKGEACLQDGKLRIKYAACKASQAVLERMIQDLTGIEETQTSKEKEAEAGKRKQLLAAKRNSQLSMYDVFAERRNTAERSA